MVVLIYYFLSFCSPLKRGSPQSTPLHKREAIFSNILLQLYKKVIYLQVMKN